MTADSKLSDPRRRYWRHDTPQPSDFPGARGRGRPVGHHRAPVQARASLAVARMAGLRQVWPCRRAAGDRQPVKAARRVQPGDPGHGRGRVRRIGAAAEPRHRADQRGARRAADRGYPCAGGSAGRGARARLGPAGRLAWVRPVAGRGECYRRRSGCWLKPHRGRPGAVRPAGVGWVYRVAGAAAARPRSGRGHRSAAHGGSGRRASGGAGGRARAGRGGNPGGDAGHGGAGAGGHCAADDAVRLRAELGRGARRGCVPQPGAAGRRGHRHSVVRQSARPAPASRRGGRGSRARAQQLPGRPGRSWSWSRPDRAPRVPAQPGAFRR
jgi:hypothetical protein